MASTTGLSVHWAVLSSSASDGGVNGSMRSPSLNGFDSAALASGAAVVSFADPAVTGVEPEEEVLESGVCFLLSLADRSLERQLGRISKARKVGRIAQRGRSCVMFDSWD